MTSLTIKGRLEVLDRFGIAAERFPAFVNSNQDPHELDVALITVVLSGHGSHLLNGEAHAVTGPSFAVTRLGERHELITDPEGLEVINVYLDLDGPPLPRIDASLDPPLAALLARGSHSTLPVPQVAIPDVDRMRAPLELLIHETRHPSAGTADITDALRRIILVTCARLVVEQGYLPSSSGSRGHPAVESIRAYLDSSYLEPHTLTELAGRVGLERTYFSRLFNRTMGESVTAYVSRLRIGYAMNRMRNGDESIVHVASASGFQDLSHFGRVFRKHTGMSPREYRLANHRRHDQPPSTPRTMCSDG
jgi:AraC-like DNA-binding protein